MTALFSPALAGLAVMINYPQPCRSAASTKNSRECSRRWGSAAPTKSPPNGGGFTDMRPFLSSNVQATNLPPHRYRPSKQSSSPDTARRRNPLDPEQPTTSTGPHIRPRHARNPNDDQQFDGLKVSDPENGTPPRRRNEGKDGRRARERHPYQPQRVMHGGNQSGRTRYLPGSNFWIDLNWHEWVKQRYSK